MAVSTLRRLKLALNKTWRDKVRIYSPPSCKFGKRVSQWVEIKCFSNFQLVNKEIFVVISNKSVATISNVELL